MRSLRIVGVLLVSAVALIGIRCERSGSDTALAQGTSTEAGRISWRQPVEVASGQAHVGPWRMNESDFRFVSDPTAAFAPGGEIGVAWVDNQRKDVFFRRYSAQGEPRPLGEPGPQEREQEAELGVNVSRTSDVFSWLPRMLITEDNEVFLLWQEIVFSGGSHGGEIFFARSLDGGAHFEKPVNLSRTDAGAGKGRLTKEQWDNGSLDLYRGPDGTLFVAWTEYEGALRLVRSTDKGETFTEPLRVAGDNERPARAPSLAAADGGLVYLAWTVGEDSGADIRLALSEDGGVTFQDPTAVFSGERHADAPQLAVDSGGTLHLVFGERAAGRSGPGQIVYTHKAGPHEAFVEPRVLSEGGEQNGNGQASATFPSLAIDAQRRIYVSWEHSPSPEERPRGLGWAISNDGGETFSRPSLVPGTDDSGLGVHGNLQGQLTDKLAVAEDGRIALVNSYFLLNEQSRVRLMIGNHGAAAAPPP